MEEVKRTQCYENEPGTLHVLVTSIKKNVVYYLIHDDHRYKTKSKATMYIFRNIYTRLVEPRE